MMRVLILEENINNDLWLKIIRAITQVKNVRPTNALERGNPHLVLFNSLPNVNHPRVLGSMVYVFIYEKKQNLK